ncbi:MAG: transposase [Pseudomonadota bacterium]
MATPRSQLVDSQQSLCYHLVSRCVRQAWLCGEHGGRCYEHRKAWIEARILHLAKSFAVDVLAYAVMSNHFHLVVYFDPVAYEAWSDEEVARRWVHAFPNPKVAGEVARSALLNDRDRLSRCRSRLGSLSAFMQHLKQPIAVEVNREDNVKGHLFEQRFYSGALLDEAAVLAAMRYVDLNPFRARIADSLEEARHTSIRWRLRSLDNGAGKLHDEIKPVVSGTVPWIASESFVVSSQPIPRITLNEYVQMLEWTMTHQSEKVAGADERTLEFERYTHAAELFRVRQRAYGSPNALRIWLQARRFRFLEKAMAVAR